ncbi:MAG TPA: RNA-binding S4 domain-containing protein [Gallionella sp.]|nr:RNA-binding S4 domain-containing protein [Gallionella sp.]
MTEESGKLRIDKWLWAARFFKTRSLAADAVESGKVLVNAVRIKPAKAVAPGDMLEIRAGQYRYEVEVLGLSNKRGPAPEAQKLYRETEASRIQRETVAAQLKAQPQPVFKGRPTKRDRRQIHRFQSENEAGGAWDDSD